MNKQKIINQLVGLYEKIELSIKNADKTTLWSIIILLSLSIIIDNAVETPNITINIQQTQPSQTTHTPIGNVTLGETVAPDETVQATNELNVAYKNTQNTSIEKAAAIKKNIQLTNDDKSKFKYCYILKHRSPDNPYSELKEDTVVFVIDEKDNNEGTTYLKTTYYSNYKESDVDTRRAWWFEGSDKMECTDEMIAKNKRERL